MRVIQLIISVCLMVVVLLSSTGVKLSQHWCGDRLVNSTLFGEATPCSHFAKSNEAQCPMHAKSKPENKCCNQKHEIFEGNDYNYDFETTQVVIPFAASIEIIRFLLIEQVLEKPAISAHFLNHSPPLLASEVAVLLQTFLF